MSQSDNQISEIVGGDDEEVGGGGGGGCDGVHGNDKEKRQRGFVCTWNFRRAKQVVLSSLPNANKKRKQKKPHQIKTLSSSSSSAANASFSGCCFCFKQPYTLDSPVESHSSDPNDPKSSYDMLKSLIEQNDFFSKESNPHIDFHPDYNLP
ncbi:hypothetical protein Ddye_029469 [Dipteronia dyeriana]|uniref:Uncharacterized protein n=1 Tax=Dipteronia dyeriana TaxID=168575 RepID=A0AAD9TF66_9ROSI|nr:hypothetical protein Ddye_029469 [Dipteronia dyeriana]